MNHGHVMKNPEPIILLRHVQKIYPHPNSGAELMILDHVDLEIGAGESVAIVGPSGSGKSTLLNIMGALDTPTSGEVILNGQALHEASDKELGQIRNREIGFVFQLHHLMPQLTVWENVLLPTLPAGRQGDASVLQYGEHLLESVGLTERMDHRPGLLSGGECQRVALVRALINQPKVLLADEPTGSLDSKTATGLQELLVRMNEEEQITLIIVTHSMELASKMNKIYELENGKLNPLRAQG